MRKRIVPLVVFACVACNGPQPGPKPVEPAATTPESSVPAASAATTGQPGAAEPVPDVDPECRGANLDLDPILSDVNKCLAGVPGLRLPEGALAVSAAPAPITVKSGMAAELVLTLRNTRSKPLAVDIPQPCGEAFNLIIQSADGTSVWSGCRLRRHCGDRPRRIVLEANGSAWVKIPFKATNRELNDTCEGVASDTPLAAGTYTMKVHTNLLGLFGTSTLHVK